MPRKPNYGFERSQRAKAKALKKAARLQAKADKSAIKKSKTDEVEAEDQPQEHQDDQAGDLAR